MSDVVILCCRRPIRSKISFCDASPMSRIIDDLRQCDDRRARRAKNDKIR
jgi:hypothetical protein